MIPNALRRAIVACPSRRGRSSMHAAKGKPRMVRFEMRRRLFYTWGVFSSLLCVALVTLWIRTYFASDDLTYFRQVGLSGPFVPARVPTLPISRAKYHIITSRGEVGVVISPVISLLHPTGWQDNSIPMLPDVPTLKPQGEFGFYVNGLPSQGKEPTFNWGTLDVKLSVQEILGVRFHYLFVPLWFTIALTAVVPALACRQFVQDYRTFGGRCAKCGYDLRASFDRCPECGTVCKAGGALKTDA